MSSPAITKTKIKVCSVSDIPIGEGREVTLDGKRIALFRSRNGSIYATQAACPHRQGPLADGIMSDTKITCPMHELLFDLVSGEALDGLCDGLKTYKVDVDSAEAIWLSIAD
ncbi:MAG: nitrite reductase (NAD(P)H) small subunit [Chloroflexi bacterium]|nr:nitrite reductase (NAD(P)H) small subunit [Chloroflexota bacterium]